MCIEVRDDAAVGTNADGSTWWRKSGTDTGSGGYCCRWTVMGGTASDGQSWEYKQTWWEKANWAGYKELGAEKSGRNATGEAWWETWKEVFRQDDLSGVGYIEKSADKWARDGEGREWSERWWEKYSARGFVDRGADKSGRDGLQAWWEKWGERWDGSGGVTKWTDKWAENGTGTRWGDKWEERFGPGGTGTKSGETWRVSPSGDRWSRTWGESHGAGAVVRKYGRSTTGEQWDISEKAEDTAYEGVPVNGWAEAVESSLQLLAIEPQERP